jgi:flagellar biosynthesis chaperone FliJ
MTIEIKCDFCQNIIKVKKGKGHSNSIESIDVKEYICTKCKLNTLQQTWEEIQDNLENEWQIIETEKKNFFKILVKNQKKEWLIEKKKKHFGTYHKEDK